MGFKLKTLKCLSCLNKGDGDDHDHDHDDNELGLNIQIVCFL